MKKIFLLVLVICGVAWYFGGSIMKKTNVVRTASVPQSNFILPDPVPLESKPIPCMTLAEYTEQVKTDPDAYNKILSCGQQQERTSFDKLMNYFAHAKYE